VQSERESETGGWAQFDRTLDGGGLKDNSVSQLVSFLF
jgi:hypothetical protein